MPRTDEFLDEVSKVIGEEIKKTRVARGLSRQQLSKKLGITHQQLAKYENGANRIAACRLPTLARLLKVKIIDFFANEIDEPLDDHSRLSMEVSRNFMKISNPAHREAIACMIRDVAKG